MFLETKNAFGLVYLKVREISSIVPADVRESKADTTRLTAGSCVTLSGGNEFYVLDTPLSLNESIGVFNPES